MTLHVTAAVPFSSKLPQTHIYGEYACVCGIGRYSIHIENYIDIVSEHLYICVHINMSAYAHIYGVCICVLHGQI